MSQKIFGIPGLADPVSSLTHLAGAAVFAWRSPGLIRRGGGDAARTVSLSVFAFSVVLLLTASGVYHILPHDTPGRAALLRLDHGAIFVLIAGTFTPVHVILFRGAWRWPAVAALWATAALGVALRSVFVVELSAWAGLLFYLGMGWAGAVVGARLWHRRGWRFVRPLVYGGLAYTVGAAADFARWPTAAAGVVGPHELFHAAVLAGVAFHWHFIGVVASEPPDDRPSESPPPSAAETGT